MRRLTESRPPATDAATYLTIVEMSLSPEILPALHEILEDVELTNDIGWDMVEMLISVPGSEDCLESIARLGNPREVILKVLEVMDKRCSGGAQANDDEDEGKEEEEEGEDGQMTGEIGKVQDPLAHKHFVTLCGMLGILHKRLQVKAPSRFLHTTLETVSRCYDATDASSTAAVIALVQSLARRTRPPLPTRKSSTKLDTPFQDSDPAKTAPDPEGEGAGQANEGEHQSITRLLQSFMTCVIEAYVNSNGLEWASRMLEYTYPERIVPGRQTMMQAFKETDELQSRDALVGQLVVSQYHTKPTFIPSSLAVKNTNPLFFPTPGPRWRRWLVWPAPFRNEIASRSTRLSKSSNPRVRPRHSGPNQAFYWGRPLPYSILDVCVGCL